jgi:hypothetical protein
MPTKKILNLHEEITHRNLRAVCEKNGALVFAKIRVADILPIEGSGISDQLFRFALQAHFDFVVADREHTPLFAVEFDGPGHDSSDQQHRDSQKNLLCEYFCFPLLRINARYLPQKYRNFDLLTWFVEVWFFHDAFSKAQEDGAVPADEICDPFMVLTLPGRKERFPLWLSAELRARIQRLRRAGKCRDFVPSEWIGVDENGNHQGVMWLRVTEDAGVIARSGIHAQRFPVIEAEVLSELLVFQLYEELDSVLRGESEPLPISEIDAIITNYEARYQLRMYGGTERTRSVKT